MMAPVVPKQNGRSGAPWEAPMVMVMNEVPYLREHVLERIAAFRRAQKRGDREAMDDARRSIEDLQRRCPHPPHRVKVRHAKTGSGTFQAGAILTVCFTCNRLLAIMGAPYRAEWDNDESFEQVKFALRVYGDSACHLPSLDPVGADESDVLKNLLIREEGPSKVQTAEAAIEEIMIGMEFLHRNGSSGSEFIRDALMYLAGRIDAQDTKIGRLEDEIERLRSEAQLRR